MAILRLSATLSLILSVSAGAAAYAQLDGFELPPGIEKTRIPRRVHYNPQPDRPAEQAQPDPEPFSLKEYKLGMSLDEFTHAPPPVSTDGSKVKCVCSCEPGQTIETVNEEDKKAKVVACGFWTTPAAGGTLTAGPYRMTVASVPCSPDFRFIEDNGVYRLFEIGISFYSSNYEDMRKALVQKYGKPTGQTVQKIKLDDGNIYPATYLNWDNGVSRIRLANIDGTNIGRAKLRYLHQRLVLAYASRINQYRSTPLQRASDDL